MPTIGHGGLAAAPERQLGKTILLQIDGLRGLAILAVLYQHAFSHGIARLAGEHGLFPYLQGNGWMGVSLFFILSGFVLALPLIGTEGKMRDPAAAIAYYGRRAKRLLPLFMIGCFVGYLVNRTGPEPLLRALTTLSMFSAREFSPSVNGPFWTLMLEIWFSILMPLLLIAAWRFGYWRLLAATVVVALVTRIVATRFTFAGLVIDPIKDSVPARLDDFVIGIVIAKLYVEGRLRDVPRWLPACGAALLAASALIWDLVIQGIVPAPIRALLNLPTSIGFACIMMACLAERSAIARVVRLWPLRVAGAMCFSIYCWHYWIMQAIDPNSLKIERVGLFLLVTAAISVLCYKFIEFPQRSWRFLLRLEDQAMSPIIPWLRKNSEPQRATG